MKNTVSAGLISFLLLSYVSNVQAQCHANFEFEYIPNTFQVHFIDQSTSEHDIVSWHWLFGDGTESDDQSPTHTYPGPGTYNACLIIMDNFGCASDECHQVIIQQSGNDCHAAFVAHQIGTTLEVEFDDQSTSDHDIISWHWTFGDGTESNLHNPHHTYDEPGTYQVCLIIEDNVGCVSDVCHEITVEGPPNTCHAAFTYEQVEGSLTIHFFDQSTSPHDIVSWHWNFGDSHTSDDQHPSHTFGEPGTYLVCLIIEDEAGCTSDECLEVTVLGSQEDCHAAFEWDQVGNSLEVHFFDQSDDDPDIVSWHWNFGDGHTSDDQNPTHTFEEYGTHAVCLIVENEFGCVSDVCWEVELEETQEGCHAAFEWEQFENSFQIHFINQSTSEHDIISYIWHFGDGSTGDGQNPNHTYAGPGTYLVCLRIEDNTGCVSEICHEVTVQESPSECHAAFEWDQVGNSLEVHFIDQSDDDPDIVSWHWNFGDGHTSNVQNPTHTFETYGTHAVCLIVTNEFGCVSDICWEVEIQQSQEGCHAAFEWEQFEDSTAIHFIDQSTSDHDIVSWLWTFGDGHSSDNHSPNHTYAEPGTYIVCLIITDNTGCISDVCHEVTVEPAQGGFQAEFQFFQMDDPMHITFSGTGSGNHTIVTWFWDFGDGQTSTDQYPVHVFAHTGTYIVCLTVTDSEGNQATNCHNLTVINDNDLCDASFTFYTDHSGNNIVFNNRSAGITDHTTYRWEFGDGTISTDENPHHAYAKAGIYTICLFVTDTSTGCSSHFCHSLTYHLNYKDLNQDANIENEQVHDANYNRLAGGVNIISYTNPVRDQMYVEYDLPQAGDVVIEIYDFMGNRKYTSESRYALKGFHTNTLQHGTLAPGMYSFVLRFGEHVVSRVVTVVN